MSHLMTKPTKWLCFQRRLRSAWAFCCFCHEVSQMSVVTLFADKNIKYRCYITRNILITKLFDFSKLFLFWPFASGTSTQEWIKNTNYRAAIKSGTSILYDTYPWLWLGFTKGVAQTVVFLLPKHGVLGLAGWLKLRFISLCLFLYGVGQKPWGEAGFLNIAGVWQLVCCLMEQLLFDVADACWLIRNKFWSYRISQFSKSLYDSFICMYRCEVHVGKHIMSAKTEHKILSSSCVKSAF